MQAIVDRLAKAMRQDGYDAVMCISPENFAYVAGFIVPSQSLMRWRHAAVIVTADGKRTFFSVDMEESTVRNRVGDCTVAVWGEFTDDPMQSLAQLLTEMGLARAKIGTELDYLCAGDFGRLVSHLPSASFVAAENLLATLRQIKTIDEIALMRKLARIADEAIFDALERVNPGDTEMDIAGNLTKNVYSLGADDFKLMIVATGPRSVFPNVGPSTRELEPQDICRIEIFAVKNGYHAGVCRTARVLESPNHAEDIWNNLVEAKYLVLDMIKPGASSRAIYEAFIKHLSKLNIPAIKFVGHGIGLHLHEEPYLGMYSDSTLEPGMVLGIEPLVYNTGYGFGMQNKDIVLVTETGSELLSDYTDTDRLLTVDY